MEEWRRDLWRNQEYTVGGALKKGWEVRDDK